MTRISLALYQPDIPQNTGTMLRMAACLATPAHIIEPAGFRLDDRAFRRAGLDYLDRSVWTRHRTWDAFESWRRSDDRRLVLLTTRADLSYVAFTFQPGDVLLVGRESVGVPEAVHAVADASITIPMAPDTRSLNVAVAAAMVLGEALRQAEELPSIN